MYDLWLLDMRIFNCFKCKAEFSVDISKAVHTQTCSKCSFAMSISLLYEDLGVWIISEKALEKVYDWDD